MDVKRSKNTIIIIILAIAIIILIAFIGFLFFMNSSGQRVKRQLSLGEKYLEEMNYEDAIIAYNLVLEIDPKAEDAYLGLADAYIGLKDYDKAYEAVKRGIAEIGESKGLTAKLSGIGDVLNKEAEPEAEPEPEPVPEPIDEEDVESEDTPDNKYVSAYLRTIDSYESGHQTGGTDGFQYDLIWFDDDDIPELVAGLNGYYVSMYTYDEESDEVFCVLDDWGYGVGGNAGYEYIPRGNTLRNYDSDYAGMIRYTYFARIGSSHELEEIGTIEEDYYIDLNGDGEPSWDPDEYTDEVQRYYNLTDGREISEEEYRRLVSTGDFEMIEGRYSADRMKSLLNEISNGTVSID